MGDTANLASRVASVCERNGWGPRPAYVCADRAFSHEDVHEGAARFAGHLGERGLGDGDRLLLALPDGIAFAWAFLGAIRAGAMPVPVDPGRGGAELRALAAELGIEAVLGDPGAVEAGARSGRVAEAVAREPDSPAYAQLTSGTTGPPKAAVHRHGDPFVFQRAFGGPVLGLAPEETVLSISKLFFAYGLGNSLFYPLLAGCRAVLVAEKPTPAGIAAAVAEHDVDVLFAVPTFYARLLAGGQAERLRRLRLAITAGEPLAESLELELERRLGVPVLDGIGSTEVGQAFASNRVGERRRGTVGRPLPPYRVRVVGEASGEPLGPGEEGLIQVAGPSILAGYLGGDDGDPREGEWLRTNDLGLLDGDGFLHVRGRSDDIEIVSGVKVNPRPLEERLAAHPKVVETAVCAVRDSAGAARLTAFVARSPGGPSDSRLAEELLARAGADDRPGHALRSVVFVPALPRTATGKLMRFRLRETGLSDACSGEDGGDGLEPGLASLVRGGGVERQDDAGL